MYYEHAYELCSSSKDKPIVYLMNIAIVYLKNIDVQIVFYIDIDEVQLICQTIINAHVQQHK